MYIKKGKLTIFAGILVLNSFFLTACTNINDYNGSTTEIIIEEKITEEDIISYFEDELINIEEIINSKGPEYKQKVKEKIIKLVDFMFFDGEIKGKKFSELSDETKNILKNILTNIDQKIEKELPDYKSQISDKYKEALKNIEIKIDNADEYLNEKIDNYDKIKESFNKTIDNTKNHFNELKDASSGLFEKGKTKIKNYYESFKNN